MFVIGELHRNLSEVVAVQIPASQTEREKEQGIHRGGLETGGEEKNKKANLEDVRDD